MKAFPLFYIFNALLFITPSIVAADAVTTSPVSSADSLQRGILSTESISLSIEEKKQVTVPFVIREVHCDNKNIETRQINERTIEINAIKDGNSVLTLLSNELVKSFRINIAGSNVKIYRILSHQLIDFPEVTIQMLEDRIALTGEISNQKHWESYCRIVEPYQSKIQESVYFVPSESMLTQLKQKLTDAEFKISDRISPSSPGQLKIEFQDRVFTISGYLYGRECQNMVEEILSSMKWLDSKWNRNSIIVKKNLRLADTQIDVGVVFVAVSKRQLEKLGNPQARGVLLTWDLIAFFKVLTESFSHWTNEKNMSASVGTNLAGTLTMLGENGVTQIRDAGHVTIANGSSTQSVYEQGGSVNVKVASRDATDLKEINYGFNLKVSGSFVRAKRLKLNLEIERSMMPERSNDDYFQRKIKTTTEVFCNLDQTLIVAGQKEYAMTRNGFSGYAFLRHVPVVNWLMADKEEMDDDMLILMLVCPQLITEKAKLAPVPSMESQETDEIVSKELRKREQKRIENEKKNWFLKIFVW